MKILTLLLTLLLPLAASADTWKVGEFVDDFGDPIGEKYIYTKAEGTFSNSATLDSKLYVKIIVDNIAYVKISLYEYTSDNPASYILNEYAKISFKNSEGKVRKEHYTGRGNSGFLIVPACKLFTNKRYNKLLSFFKKSKGDVKVAISYGFSNYNFKINVDGFAEAFEKVRDKKRTVAKY